MTRTSGKRNPRRIRLMLALMAGTLLVLFACFGALSNPDQPPTELSLRYLDAPASIAAGDNAALLLADLDTLPGTKPSADVHGFAQIGASDQPLLAWAAQNATGLETLRTANALRLQRYAEAQQRPGWQCAEPVSCNVLGWVGTAKLQRAMIALEFHRARTKDDRLAISNAIAALRADIAFWDRLAAQADSALAALVVASAQRAGWQLATEVTEALPPGTHAALAPDLLALVEAAPINWDSVLRGEARFYRVVLPGTEPGGGECGEPAWMRACLSWTERLSYQPQATLNLWVELHDALADALTAPPANRALARARYARAHGLIEPGNVLGIAMHWSYNHAGLERIRAWFSADSLLTLSDLDQERLKLRRRINAAVYPSDALALAAVPNGS